MEYLDPPEMSLDDDEEDDEVQLKSSNRGGRRFTITHEKSMMVVKGAAATAQGVLNWVVKTLNKIRVPIRTKSIRKKMVDRSIRRSYERAFVKAAGALHKTLRRQNMRMFLRDLLPRYAIREGQAEVVMTWLTDQPDGVTWGQLSNWLEAQVEFEEEMKMSQINTEAKIATEISKRCRILYPASLRIASRAW